jgi:hypothetical protein
VTVPCDKRRGENMRRLGKAIGIIARNEADENFMHADVDAFHAPSECHELVARGETKRRRLARRHAKSVSGLSRTAFNRELSRVTQRVMMNAISRIYNNSF